MKTLKHFATVFILAATSQFAAAQDDPHLHVNPRWEECSFQLDASLTQQAWHQFAKEAGLVIYYRPLINARPLGARHFEFSILQWSSKIDDTKDAWNDTFVHPDSAHWLVEGPRLPIPGLTFRYGLTDKLDVAVYWTKSMGANYGFYGAQAQYSLLNNVEKKFSTAARASFVNMYGPEDVKLTVYGLDLIASREFVVHERWLTLAPYVGVSSFLTSAHEKSAVTDVRNENVLGVQGMGGLVAKSGKARVGVEYNLSRINTVSFKLGLGF